MERRVGDVCDARMPEGIPRKANRTESGKSRVAFFRGGGYGVVHVRVDDVEMRGKRGDPLLYKNARVSKMLAGSAGRREGGGQAKADGRRSEGVGEAGRRYIYARDARARAAEGATLSLEFPRDPMVQAADLDLTRNCSLCYNIRRQQKPNERSSHEIRCICDHGKNS